MHSSNIKYWKFTGLYVICNNNRIHSKILIKYMNTGAWGSDTGLEHHEDSGFFIHSKIEMICCMPHAKKLKKVLLEQTHKITVLVWNWWCQGAYRIVFYFLKTYPNQALVHGTIQVKMYTEQSENWHSPFWTT